MNRRRFPNIHWGQMEEKINTSLKYYRLIMKYVCANQSSKIIVQSWELPLEIAVVKQG